MATLTPLTILKVKTTTDVIDIPIYNLTDISSSSFRIKTSKGIGCCVLVEPSIDTPLRIMTDVGIKGIQLTPILLDNDLPVQDSFNRIDATTLGNTDTGQIWQSYGTNNVWGISGNQAYPITPIWDDPVYVETDMSDNVAYQMKVGIHHSTFQMMWRIADGNNYFVLQGNTVNRVINDGWVPLGTISPSIVAGDVVRVELRGDSHVIKINNVVNLTFTYDLLMNGTKFGFSTNSNLVRIDDVLIEPIV